MYRGGLNYMRYSVSDTAEFGDYVSGPRIIDERVRATMKQILTEIQDGTFAKTWIAENKSGRSDFDAMRGRDRNHAIEAVGAELRERMTWLDAVTAPEPQTTAGDKQS
jgi:ketol-acid reductoisomerase